MVELKGCLILALLLELAVRFLFVCCLFAAWRNKAFTLVTSISQRSCDAFPCSSQFTQTLPLPHACLQGESSLTCMYVWFDYAICVVQLEFSQ